jgi:glyoxylase-like metal-dependent hydrolase (beta-lactamase superfamily II)
MKITLIGVLPLLASLPVSLWAAGGLDAKTIIAGATKVLGADNLKSIEFSGSGYDFAIGQAPNPSAPWPRFNDKTYTRVINFETPASRMQRTRTQAENPPRGGGQQPIVGEQQQTQGVSESAAWDDLMMIVPYGFLKAAAAAPDTKVTSKSMGGKKYTVLTFTAFNKAAASAYLNSDSVLERVETKIDNTVLGDIVFETAFTDYKDFAGLKFPTHIVQKQGGYPVLDLTIVDVKPNAPANIQPVVPQGAPPAPAAAPSEKLSDGVFLILGGYAALALDFGDHIVVVEGPQSDQRADAVIAAAKQLIPGKPIKYVVNTHAHFDHAGGLRDFVAEGATVITHQMNKPYYEKVWANPHTLVPDRLSKNPRKPTFKTLTDQMELTGNGHTLVLYHMQNFLHNDGILMVYLPKEKILLEADAFNPPAQPITQTPATISPYNQALVANIDRLKLDVQRIIPVHYPADNRVTTMAELMKSVGK